MVNQILLPMSKMEQINNDWVQKNKTIVDTFYPIFPEFEVCVTGVPSGYIDESKIHLGKDKAIIKGFSDITIRVKEVPITAYLDNLAKAQEQEQNETLRLMMKYEWTESDSAILIQAKQFDKKMPVHLGPVKEFRPVLLPIKQGAITSTHTMSLGYYNHDEEKVLNEAHEKLDAKNLEFFFTCILGANAYLYHNKQDFRERERDRVTPRVPAQYVDEVWIPRKPAIIEVYTEYSLIRNVNNNKVPKPHIWHISAWSVRGHTRTYKSGKVIHIASYVKGKDRNDETKLQQKVYRMRVKEEI